MDGSSRDNESRIGVGAYFRFLAPALVPRIATTLEAWNGISNQAGLG